MARFLIQAVVWLLVAGVTRWTIQAAISASGVLRPSTTQQDSRQVADEMRELEEGIRKLPSAEELTQSAASARPATPEEFVSLEGRFAVAMPARPTYEKRTDDSLLGRLDVHDYTCSKKDVCYAVQYFDLPDATPISNRKSFIRAAAAGAAATTAEAIEGQIVSEKPISLGDCPGREVCIGTPKAVFLRMRFYLDKKRMYQVMSSSYHSEVATEQNERFLNSFRIVKQ